MPNIFSWNFQSLKTSPPSLFPQVLEFPIGWKFCLLTSSAKISFSIKKKGGRVSQIHNRKLVRMHFLLLAHMLPSFGSFCIVLHIKYLTTAVATQYPKETECWMLELNKCKKRAVGCEFGKWGSYRDILLREEKHEGINKAVQHKTVL